MKPANTIILTGPVHSGKSTALMQWLKHKPVVGFVTPTVSGKKVFIDIAKQEYTPYEVENSSDETISIGQYFLDKKAFETANYIVVHALQHPSPCFVLDEIGKLELNGQGHYDSLVQLLQHWQNDLLMVVRDSLLLEVVVTFSLTNFAVINKESLLQYNL